MVSCMDGTDRSSIQTHCAGAAGAARERARVEPARAQCHPVCRRAWLHVAGIPVSVRAVAHPQHPDESLVKERGPHPGVRTPPEGPTRPDQAGGGVAGPHPREGSSRRDGCAKTNGPLAIGKARGGWTTKMHRVAAEARTAVTVSRSPGQTHDAPEGSKLLHRLGAQREPAAFVDGPGIQRQRDPPACADVGVRPGRSSVQDPARTLGRRPAAGQTAQRGHATVPATERVPSHLLSIRETQCDLPRLRRVRSHLRRTALV